MARHNRSGNVGLPTQRMSTMDEFDALPPRMRELMRYAALNYSVVNLPERIQRLGLDGAAQFTEQNMRLQTRIAARNTYGPDHPQAQ